MGIRKSHAQLFAERMAELHRELERDKLIRKRQRKEHRNEWRRQYRQKKKAETVSSAAAHNLAALCADKSEQKRAGRVKWRLETDVGVKEVKPLLEWCEVIRAQFSASITSVELEALLRDERYVFKSTGEIADHLDKSR